MVDLDGHNPGGFRGILGQNVPARVLTHLVESDRLPGTLLFSGPGGVGKLAAALALAKMLHCSEGDGAECECVSCRAIRTGTHPDIIVISRDRLIGVDEMRELVALAGLRTADGRQRVIIIDRAENVTPAASNAALKTLEEPGDRVRFILITDTPAALLPTVRSRAYRLRFTLVAPAAMEDFARLLGDKLSDADTQNALRFAAGRPGRYLRWRRSAEYRGIVGEVAGNVGGLVAGRSSRSLESALAWKGEFWGFAERLASAERQADIPRGADAFEITRHLADPAGFPVAFVNWRIEDAASRETRWGQGRKALLLAGLIRGIMSGGQGGRARKAVGSLQDFMEKIRFNCNFDIALERLYFSLAGR